MSEHVSQLLIKRFVNRPAFNTTTSTVAVNHLHRIPCLTRIDKLDRMAATTLLIAPTTPPDYHRIVSPTLSIPSDPHISVPVGLLACQRTVCYHSFPSTRTLIN